MKNAPRKGYVHFYRIIGTDCVVARVEEHTGNIATHTHGAITTIQGVWHGELGTRTLPARIEALPRGDERYNACVAYRQAQITLAHDLIITHGLASGILTTDHKMIGSIDHCEWFDAGICGRVEALGAGAYISITYDDSTIER